MPLGDTDPFTPTRQRPVRLRARALPADTHFEPHAHAWAQLAYCATGIVQVTAQSTRLAPDEITYIVPPSRAVWIAPGALHQISVLEAAQFRTLYIDASAAPPGWTGCRAMVVSALLREVIEALDSAALMPDETSRHARESLLTGLVLDEISHAGEASLGVPMPHPDNGDKRLRALCEAVLRSPTAHATMAGWAAQVGASERTVARLFRQELGLGTTSGASRPCWPTPCHCWRGVSPSAGWRRPVVIQATVRSRRCSRLPWGSLQGIFRTKKAASPISMCGSSYCNDSVFLAS
jgi:AraC-like DNA-binding protein